MHEQERIILTKVQNHLTDTHMLDENILEILYHALPSSLTPLTLVVSNFQAPEEWGSSVWPMHAPVYVLLTNTQYIMHYFI